MEAYKKFLPAAIIKAQKEYAQADPNDYSKKLVLAIMFRLPDGSEVSAVKTERDKIITELTPTSGSLDPEAELGMF